MRASPPSELIQFAGRLGQELETIRHAVLQAADTPVMAGSDGSYASARRTLNRNTLITEKLLAFAGQLDLSPTQIDLNLWLPHFVKQQRFRYPAGVQIFTNIPEERLSIRIDSGWLRHALIELMNNACEAMPDGGRLTLSITRTEEDMRTYLRVAVSDTGIGMEPALLAHVQEPMVTTKGKGSHRGWGLSVCQGFARQSGGWLELESNYRRGSTATLVLPQADNLFPALHLGQPG